MFPVARPRPDGTEEILHFTPNTYQGAPKYPFRYMYEGDRFFIPDYMLPKKIQPLRQQAFHKDREVRFLPAENGVFVYCERVHGDAV